MIWLGPIRTRETVPHEEDGACLQHCHSCDVDHHGGQWDAFRWCYECGHAYRDHHALRAAYLAEAPYGRWSWRFWRIMLAPKGRLYKLIGFCPLCMHDFLPVPVLSVSADSNTTHEGAD